MSDEWDELIRAVHASSQQVVLCATGGGASAIGQLLSVPGGSRSVLEAVVPYAPQALDQWLKRKPDAYCSSATALSMASMSWGRAKHLVESCPSHRAIPAATSRSTKRLTNDVGMNAARKTTAALLDASHETLIGLSCTASLASDRPKKGAHRCFIATQTANETRLLALTLQKGARDRRAEEDVVSRVMLLALAEACGVRKRPQLELLPGEHVVVEHSVAKSKIRDVWTGAAPLVWAMPDGKLSKKLQPRPVGLLSGAFNPLHHGHERLARAAEKKLKGAVAYEMPIVNADKPRLDYLSIEARRGQFKRRPLALTSAPLFVDKARLFPQTTFVVGFDTAERLLDARFFDGSEERLLASFDEIRDLGCRFLVAGRLTEEGFETLADLPIPSGLADLFDGLSEAEFRDDVSSTEMRLRALKSGS